MILHRIATPLAMVLLLATGIDHATAQQHLAVSHGDQVTILNADTAQLVDTVTGFQDVRKLAYRPDGKLLAIGACDAPQVIEVKSTNYKAFRFPFQRSCASALTYSPDNRSIAAITSPSPILFNQASRLRVRGPNLLDRSLGVTIQPLPIRPRLLHALAYRPGGTELAFATPTGFRVVSTNAAYGPVAKGLGLRVLSLAYTTDGARLIVGTSNGFQIRNATAGYALLSSHAQSAVIDIAVAHSGGWIALVSSTSVSVRRAPDLVEAVQFSTTHSFRDADFTTDGSLLALAEEGQVRRFRVGTWQELSSLSISIAAGARVNAIAFRPRDFRRRIPVLFVHGHSGNSAEAWFQSGSGPDSTSFAETLSANPQLPIDAFYLELPVHDGTNNLNRTITEDAQDILAAIEGGTDSRGNIQVGILNLPAYQSDDQVAIVAYSQGTLSSRYYIKNLMGTRHVNDVTVSEFVTLAAPNHGVGDLLSCGNFANPNPADRARRQLCGGHVGTMQGCNCGIFPRTFANNQPGDETFISDLNGHSLLDTCNANQSFAGEAPFSRPSRSDGILYVNVFGNQDTLVGDDSQPVDCVGRRKARNLAPDAINREINNIPATVHSNVPHHLEVICTALRTVTDHQAPNAASACTGITSP